MVCRSGGGESGSGAGIGGSANNGGGSDADHSIAANGRAETVNVRLGNGAHTERPEQCLDLHKLEAVTKPTNVFHVESREEKHNSILPRTVQQLYVMRNDPTSGSNSSRTC